MLTIEAKFKDGRAEKFSFEEKLSVMIGRAPGNDISLDVDGVSRYHLRIVVDNGQVIVEDLESTNGIFVGAEKVSKAVLKKGDKVTLGEIVLSVSYEANETPLESFSELATDNVTNSDSKTLTEIKVPTVAEDKQSSAKTSASSDDIFYWKSLESFLSPIWPYINDDSVSEVMINGPHEIYIESKGKLKAADAVFTEAQLNAAVLNIAQYVGRRVSEEEPYLDARLPDGSRVAILLPPCSRKGVSISIRKFSKEKLTVEKLQEFGSITAEMVTFLKAAVILKKNIIISGGTSSGKTSLLNVLSSLIPDDERILTIEDSAELQLVQDHVLPMETKPPDKKGRGQVTIRDLVKASLRMRPDRIVVGEIRGGEALDLLQAMNTGHSGSMATVHANNPMQALTRLETLSLFSGFEIPIRALRDQVSSAIDIVIQASRLPDHSRKVVYISEILPLREDGSYEVRDIFRYERTGVENGMMKGAHKWTGEMPTLIDEMRLAGLDDALRLFESK